MSPGRVRPVSPAGGSAKPRGTTVPSPVPIYRGPAGASGPTVDGRGTIGTGVNPRVQMIADAMAQRRGQGIG